MIAEKQTKLIGLLTPHAQTPTYQRVQLWIQGRTNSKLIPFLQNEAVSEAEREKVLDDLIDIIERQAWDKLPAAPNGQAAPPPSQKPAPVPMPAAAVPAKNGTHKAEHAALPPAQQLVPAAAPDPIAAITAALKSLIPPQQQSLHEERVREIVREEVAKVFASFSTALEVDVEELPEG